MRTKCWLFYIILILTPSFAFSDSESIMSKKIIFTEEAPKALGPYSQGVVVGNTLYISGQIPLNPETETLVSGSIKEQAEQVISNLESICSAANAGILHNLKLRLCPSVALRRFFSSIASGSDTTSFAIKPIPYMC